MNWETPAVIPAFKLSKRGQRALVNYYFTLLTGGRENLPGEVGGRQDPMISHIREMAAPGAAQVYADQIRFLDLQTRERQVDRRGLRRDRESTADDTSP